MALQQTLMPSKGLYAGLTCMIAGATLMAYFWANRARCYFVASAGNMSQGDPTVRLRWRETGGRTNIVDDKE